MDTIGVITGIEPYTTEWFEARKGVFTASEIFKLMTEPRSKKKKDAGELSEGANTYILEKVHEKLTGIVKPTLTNYATDWGINNEPLATEWYRKLTGAELSPPYLVFHEAIPGFACTPDHFVSRDGELGLIEVKCPANGANHFKHCFITTDEYFRDEHPEYYWQCQAQMNITGREWCDFISFDPRVPTDLGLFIYRLKYDGKAGQQLENQVKKARELFEGYYESFSR